MSRLKVDNIETRSGNNVAMDDALKLKSYSTTDRNALTSVAGDMIYNSDDNKVQVYNGSSWDDLGGATFEVAYLVIAGGGGGAGAKGGGAGGGGAGGYLNSYASENSGDGSATLTKSKILSGNSYTVTVGGGGSGGTNQYNSVGGTGSNSVFDTVVAYGGGGGSGSGQALSTRGGSGGGAGANLYAGSYNDQSLAKYYRPADGTIGQGNRGGYPVQIGVNNSIPGGGGGGSNGNGGNGSSNNKGGNGGHGTASSITGSSVERAGGGGAGGGGTSGNSGGAVGGTGQDGGGNGGTGNGTGTAGSANTGGGGGGSSSTHTNGYTGGAGGSGIVILRYATADVASYSQSGLTISSSTDGSDTVLQITAGTGTITFS
tara:strand:- start:1116 stop:2234 length:1119 start_codon:yes stop_codon:yes gene_type:complete